MIQQSAAGDDLRRDLQAEPVKETLVPNGDKRKAGHAVCTDVCRMMFDVISCQIK